MYSVVSYFDLFLRVCSLQARRKSLNDSLEGDIQAFLGNEAELHTYDDLTKVNPVTPTTGMYTHAHTTAT